MIHEFFSKLYRVSLIKQILVGLIIGIIIALALPSFIPAAAMLGTLFVKALKGVAPVLVFFLVMNAMASKKEDGDTRMKPIIVLYIIGTFCASLVAVSASFMFPSTLHLQTAESQINPPSGIIAVVSTLLINVVDNPVGALLNANYIGILAWAILIGIALRPSGEATKKVLDDVAAGITVLVQWIIHMAPLGIMGLVADSVGTHGISSLVSYIHLLAVLLGSFFFVALIMNPFIVFLKHSPQSLPAGVDDPARKRLVCVLYAQLGRQYPGQPEPVQTAGSQSGYVYRVDPPGCYSQHGWCIHYHSHLISVSSLYVGDSRRFTDGIAALHRIDHRCLWRFWRCRRLIAAHSCGLFVLRHWQ